MEQDNTIYAADSNKNVETIVQWSPFSSKADLLQQAILHSSNVETFISYNVHFSCIVLFLHHAYYFFS